MVLTSIPIALDARATTRAATAISVSHVSQYIALHAALRSLVRKIRDFSGRGLSVAVNERLASGIVHALTLCHLVDYTAALTLQALVFPLRRRVSVVIRRASARSSLKIGRMASRCFRHRVSELLHPRIDCLKRQLSGPSPRLRRFTTHAASASTAHFPSSRSPSSCNRRPRYRRSRIQHRRRTAARATAPPAASPRACRPSRPRVRPHRPSPPRWR